MKIAALIVAAGRGLRAGGDVPKQWRMLAGKPMLEHTIARIKAAPEITDIVLVVHPDDTVLAAGFAPLGVHIAIGGADRAASVQNGLARVAETGASHVLIHDGARPCVTGALIARIVRALETSDAAAPGLEVTDALWTGAAGAVTGTRERAGLFRAQTPQGFDLKAIQAAHAAHPGGAGDDVEVARAAGLAVQIVPGDADNIKVTRPEDFERAARILGGRMDIRLGNGFDVHKFGPGDHVVLCGVRVPFDQGLVGHSDADVGLHAVTDAIYGALAMGDIGQHFPPSDDQWKGAASDIFLRHAVELSARHGFTISNVDLTLICEFPKIGPVAQQMRDQIGAIMGLEVSRVSVKATTSEKLGFTGRGEGIAALASATLVAS
ncbi:MAG: bifunctional 2-C-methyl-D-erythritol 4-phosphate cytidylyltransferase/2-C-methyl-D-erythritol 2,4-cyclodiphosphate synthase [Sedimentitalea sp.]